MSLGIFCFIKKHPLCKADRILPAFQRYGPAVLTICFSTLCATAQQVSAVQQSAKIDSSKHQTTISDVVLYHQFFRHFLYLDRQVRSNALAAKQDLNNIEGNSYQKKLSFDAEQFDVLRSSAVATEQAVAEIDAKAHQIVLAYRAKNPVVSANAPLPPPPPELAVLQQQRNELIQQHINVLRSQLSSDSSRTLDTFLHTQFAPHRRVTFVGVPRPHDPTKNPVAPFERIR